MSKKYCKAYCLKDCRQFSGWSEGCLPESCDLPDSTVCYLWDDFTVVSSPVQDGGLLFDKVTPEWKEFCWNTLQFSLPSDLQPSAEFQPSVEACDPSESSF